MGGLVQSNPVRMCCLPLTVPRNHGAVSMLGSPWRPQSARAQKVVMVPVGGDRVTVSQWVLTKVVSSWTDLGFILEMAVPRLMIGGAVAPVLPAGGA